jgi:hypothetical protein
MFLPKNKAMNSYPHPSLGSSFPQQTAKRIMMKFIDFSQEYNSNSALVNITNTRQSNTCLISLRPASSKVST